MERVCELPECEVTFETTRINGFNAKSYCCREHKDIHTISRRKEKYLSTEGGYSNGRAYDSRRTAERRNAIIDPLFTNAILADILINTLACQHCGTKLTLKQRIIDHKLAIVNGGQHEASNITILCEDCHKIKTALDLLDAWDARAQLTG